MESKYMPEVASTLVARAQHQDEGPRVYTYKEVAFAMKVQKQTVYEWVKRGMIPSPIYTGSTARFTQEMFTAIVNEPKVHGKYTPAPSHRAEVGKLGGPKPKPKPKRKKVATAPPKQGKKDVRKKDKRKDSSTPKKRKAT